MPFEWDDLQEKAWLTWCRQAGAPAETKRRVAGGALHVDVVVWSKGAVMPALAFVRAGVVVVENKAPGTTVTEEILVGFHGRLWLFLERELVEKRRRPGLEGTSGIILASRLSGRLREGLLGGLSQIGPGFWLAEDLVPRTYLVAADEVAATAPNAPLILYYGSDDAVRRLVREVDPSAYMHLISRLFILRRIPLRDSLIYRGIDMSKVKIDIRGAVEELGFARVIEELGLGRVIEEVGLARVIEEVGLARVIEEVGLDRVIHEAGVEATREALRRLESEEGSK